MVIAIDFQSYFFFLHSWCRVPTPVFACRFPGSSWEPEPCYSSALPQSQPPHHAPSFFQRARPLQSRAACLEPPAPAPSHCSVTSGQAPPPMGCQPSDGHHGRLQRSRTLSVDGILFVWRAVLPCHTHRAEKKIRGGCLITACTGWSPHTPTECDAPSTGCPRGRPTLPQRHLVAGAGRHIVAGTANRTVVTAGRDAAADSDVCTTAGTRSAHLPHQW